MKLTSSTLIMVALLMTNHLQAQVWEQQQPAFAHKAVPYEVAVPTATDAWAMGIEFDSATIFTPTEVNYALSRTTDGGETWEAINFPHTEPGYFSNIAALNGDVAWISYIDYANGNLLLKTTDGGQSWTTQSNVISTWVNFVHFFDASTGVAVGDADDKGFEIYTTSDGGENWARIDSINIPPEMPFETGYSGYFETVGDELWFETSRGRVYYSADHGHTWSVFAGPQPGQYSLVAVDDTKTVYIGYTTSLPDATDPETRLYRSHDNGNTWEEITPLDNGWWIWDIEPVPGTDVIIAEFNRGFTSGIYETRLSYDQGTSWTTIDNSTLILNLDFFDDRTGYAGGWQFPEDDSPTDVYSYIGSAITGLFDPKPLDVNVSVSPNPTSGLVSIQLDSPRDHEYVLLLNDMVGRLIFKEDIAKTSAWNTSVDLHDAPAGMYTLTISTSEGVAIQKLVRQ